MTSTPGSPGQPVHQAETDRASVVAVIVTFQPDIDRLQRLLEALIPQVGKVVLVDNASTGALPGNVHAACTVLPSEHNSGLAAAQNAGIAWARGQGAAWVLLLDQDSVPGPGMVAELLRVHDEALPLGLKVAAVGPAPLDGEGRFEGFTRFRNGRYQAITDTAQGQSWIPCDFLIASGSLIPVHALSAIGGMDERLFIDKIDTDWCLRALEAGWCLLGAPQASLHHSLGERRVRLWFGRWRVLSQHRPFRYYYMVRNSLLLRRHAHAAAAWRSADLRQLRSIVLYFGILAPGRLQASWMMLRGALDGLRGISGPLR